MRPSQVSAFLDSVINSNNNNGRKYAVHLEGPPGVCKSSLVMQAAERNGCDIITFHPVFREPVDLMGVPDVVDGKTVWCPPDYIPDDVGDKPFIFLIDELAQAEAAMQKACAPICLERTVAGKPLPKNCTVISTGNRAGDKAGSFKLLTHLRNRLIPIQVEANLDDFTAWGMRSGRVSQAILAFLEWRKAMLLVTDTTGEGQSATPRSWEMASMAYKDVEQFDKGIKLEVLAGCVGQGPATEFIAFSEIYMAMSQEFDLGKICKSPATAKLPAKDAVSLQYALVGALSEHACQLNLPKGEKVDTKMIQGALQYMLRLPSEFATIGFRNTMMLREKEALATKEMNEFFIKHSELLALVGMK